MKIGDLVRNRALGNVGLIVRIKSYTAIDDTITVLYGDGETVEHVDNLEPIPCSSRS